MNFSQKSYAAHTKSYEPIVQQEHVLFYKNWFDSETTDLWRHLRMMDGLDPFLEIYKGASWLTVGDGNFGTAAIYINRSGGKALATDIDESLLIVAKNEGLINDYKYENAEHLSFDDNSFDFSFCKESFHHFPRPIIALYEMVRCTRKAILFTEPNEWKPAPVPIQILQIVKNGIKKAFSRKPAHTDTGNYETIGNYVYCISKREFEKIAMAMNLPAIAYKEFHDVYMEGAGMEKRTGKAKLYRKIKRKIAIINILSWLGLSVKNRITYIIFKEEPDLLLREQIKLKGFKVIDLPRNPFL